MVNKDMEKVARFKEYDSFVDKLVELENPAERMREMDHNLRVRLLNLAERSPQRRLLFFELDLSTDEYSLLTAELGAYFSAGRPVDRLFVSYPRVVVGALVGAAMQSTREGALWPTFWQLIGTEPVAEFERRIRADARTLLESNYLDSFRGANLGFNTYVSLFLLHAGLTSSQTVDILSYSHAQGWHAQAYLNDDARPRVEALIAAIRSSDLNKESLLEFVTYAPDMALDVYERLLELIPYLSHVGIDESFQGTNGLPSLAFDSLVNLLEKGQVGEVKTRQKSAVVVYVPESNSIALEFPRVLGPETGEHAGWEVDVELLSGGRQSLQVPMVGGYGESPRIALGQPFTQVEVRAADPAIQDKFFAGVQAGRPFYFISHANRLVSPTGGLAAARYTVLAPRGTNVRDSRGIDLGQPSRAAHPDWEGWESFVVDLREASSFQVETPEGDVFTYPVGSAKLYEWLTNVEVIPNVRGKDAQPVYSESPRLRLRGELQDQWVIQGFYEPLDEDPVHMFTMEVEQTDTVVTVDVFPFDDFEDPWVGRFGVTLYRNGVVQDSNLFSVLESVDLRTSTSAFRVMSLDGRFSAWSYTFQNHSGKRMSLPSKTKTMPTTRASQTEVVSAAGYSLAVDVVPPTMQVRYKNQSSQPVESADVPTIIIDQLDPNGAVHVRAPEALPLGRLVLAGVGRHVLDLEQAAPRVNGTRTVQVANRVLDSAMGDRNECALMLVWSTMSKGSYLNSLTDSQRASYSKKSWEGREEMYREAAENSIDSALIARLIRQPLVESVSLGEAGLRVQQPQGADRELLGWVWALGDPGKAPGSLERDGDYFRLPQNFQGVGPLVLDFREETFLCDTTAPESPTANALLLEQPGTPERSEGEWSPMMYNLGYLDDPGFNSRNIDIWMKEMWHSVHLLRYLPKRPEFKEFYAKPQQAICTEPRHALDALDRTLFSQDELLPLFIESGLFARSLVTPETTGSPHSEQLFSVLEEIADSVYLKWADPTGEELKDSRRWVAAYGSEELLNALDHGIDRWTTRQNDTRRSRSTHAVLQHADRFIRLGFLAHLLNVAKQLEDFLGRSGVDNTNAALVAATLREEPQADLDAAQKMAYFVPYISYVTMLAARFVANHQRRENKALERCAQLLMENRDQLARLARQAPEIFEQDLLIAEALSQHHSFAGEENR